MPTPTWYTKTQSDTLLGAKADLVGGVIPSGQIPALALTNAVPVASQAAMLALTATQVQPGDVAVRSDGAGTFILTAPDPTQLASWTRLNAPTDVVSSVNGRQGAVVLSAADVGADPAGAAAAVSLAGLGGAPTASPAFTGTPTIGGTAVAKTSDITAAIAGVVGAAPSALDTLAEIDGQLQADEGSAAALAALVGTKASKGSAPLALTEFMIERLRTFLDWCRTNSVTPYIGEVGWPSDTVKPGEGAGWNDLGEQFYTLLDEYAVAATFFDATKKGVGDPNRAYGSSTITTGGTMGGTLDAKFSQATVLERHTTAALRGVNMADCSGANLRVNGATTTFYMGNAGTLNTDYQYPTQADFAYLVGLGYRIFRLPIFLERLLTAPGSTLVAGELAAIQACVAACAAAGGKVILDCHGFGQVGVAGTVYQVGSATFSYGHFADFWTKVSTVFKGNAGVQGYGLMNEPWGGGSYGLYTAALQQAINAIRGNADTTLIIVATDNFDIQGMPPKPYTDSASNLWYEAHIYPDYYGTYTSSLRNFEVQAKNMAALAPGRDYPVATAATVVEETMSRFMGNSNFTPTSGTLNLWYFTALGGHTVSKAYLKTRGTAAAGITFASIGLYLVNSDDSVTLLTSTATDNTLFTATFTNYTKTFAPTQPLIAGQRYALGLLIVGTTMPILYGCGSLVDADISPRITGQLAGQASLPASVAIGSIASAAGGPYARLS